MQLRARLVHADDHRRVVEVSAREGDQALGSALGEGATAEEAEDRAIARLRQRLGAAAGLEVAPPQARPAPLRRAAEPAPTPARMTEPMTEPAISPAVRDAPGVAAAGTTPSPIAPPTAPSEAPPTAPSRGQPEEPPADPDDWSAELADIELQLRRLGWDREREATYLQRAFGHPSRSRLTTYADLLAYLRALEDLEPDSDPGLAATPLRRRDLLAQSDQLLAQLGWDAERGRSFLEQELGAASRRQLSDQQLLQFNMALETAWIDRAHDAGGQASAGDPVPVMGR
jgi:hypothetical protein